MGAILAKLGSSQALGAYGDERAVHFSRVVATFRGTRVLEQLSIPIEQDEASAWQAGLRQLGARLDGLPIVLGVPLERSYFATRPVSLAGKAAPTLLLRESLRSVSAPADQLIADTLAFRPDAKEVVSIAACDRQWLADHCRPFVEQRRRLVGVEPAACALLRLAERLDRQRRPRELTVRVFLNDTQLLAVLAQGVKPVVWRSVPLAPGDEASAILAVVRCLTSVAPPCGVDRVPDAVVVHGRRDLERLVDVPWLAEHVGQPIRWLDEPAFTGSDIAHGLGLRGLEERDDVFDLAREQRQRPPLWQLFPWREAVAYAALLLVMAGLFLCRCRQLEVAVASAHEAADHLVSPTVATSDLQRERTDLQARVAAVKKFLDSRIVWTTPLRELAKSLPDNIYLTSLQGDAEYPAKDGQGSAKRTLVIKGAVALSADGVIPPEVDRVMETIRNHPAIAAAGLPLVELADLKRLQRLGGGGEMALFTVVCLPKKAKREG